MKKSINLWTDGGNITPEQLFHSAGAITLRFADAGDVENLSRAASFGMLKKLHAASGNGNIARLFVALRHDVWAADNCTRLAGDAEAARRERDALNKLITAARREAREIMGEDARSMTAAERAELSTIRANIADMVDIRAALSSYIRDIESDKGTIFSDAADILGEARLSILADIADGARLGMIDCNGGASMLPSVYDTIFSRPRRDGTERRDNVFSRACSAARRHVYSNRGIMEGSANYTYIADITERGETEAETLERGYIRAGKWYDMPDIVSYMETERIISDMALTRKQEALLSRRMRGESMREAARKLGINESTARERMAQIMVKYAAVTDILDADALKEARRSGRSRVTLPALPDCSLAVVPVPVDETAALRAWLAAPVHFSRVSIGNADARRVFRMDAAARTAAETLTTDADADAARRRFAADAAAAAARREAEYAAERERLAAWLVAPFHASHVSIFPAPERKEERLAGEETPERREALAAAEAARSAWKNAAEAAERGAETAEMRRALTRRGAEARSAYSAALAIAARTR